MKGMSHWNVAADARSMKTWLLVVPGTLAALMALAAGGPMSDWDAATTGGHYLMSGHLTVYADMPQIQMGPLALLLGGALPGLVYVVTVCALLPLVSWIVTLPYRQTRQTYFSALIGGMLLAWPWAAFGVQGHADDALVVLGIVVMVSALSLHREAWLVAGFAVAIAAKPTAILFLPLPFMHSRRSGVLATLLGVLIWAPFVLADVPGFLAAGSGQGELWPYSMPALLGSVPHTGIPAWVRPVQLVGGTGLCWFLARRRGGPAAAVAGVFAFRVLLEPGTWNYYSTSVIAAAIMLDLYFSWRVPWATLLAFVSFVSSFGAPLTVAQGVVRILALMGVLALAFAGGQAKTSRSGEATFWTSALDRRAPAVEHDERDE
jgi:hypothetical protein